MGRGEIAGDGRVIDGRRAEDDNSATETLADGSRCPGGSRDDEAGASVRTAASAAGGGARVPRSSSRSAEGPVGRDHVGCLGLRGTRLGPEPGLDREGAAGLNGAPLADAAVAAIAAASSDRTTAGSAVGSVTTVAADGDTAGTGMAAEAARDLIIRREVHRNAGESGGPVVGQAAAGAESAVATKAALAARRLSAVAAGYPAEAALSVATEPTGGVAAGSRATAAAAVGLVARERAGRWVLGVLQRLECDSPAGIIEQAAALTVAAKASCTTASALGESSRGGTVKVLPESSVATPASGRESARAPAAPEVAGCGVRCKRERGRTGQHRAAAVEDTATDAITTPAADAADSAEAPAPVTAGEATRAAGAAHTVGTTAAASARTSEGGVR